MTLLSILSILRDIRAFFKRENDRVDKRNVNYTVDSYVTLRKITKTKK